MWPIAKEDPLGIVHEVQPEGSYFWDGAKMLPLITRNYAPKLSNKIFSAGTPRLSSRLTTDCAIIGGPHIR